MRLWALAWTGLVSAALLVSCADGDGASSRHPPTQTAEATALRPTPTPGCNPTPGRLPTATPIPAPTATPTVAPVPTSAAVPLPPPGPEERWIDVDIGDQTATGMLDNQPWHTALVTTGKPGFATPLGEFTIIRRVYNDTMTSGPTSGEYWYVDNVLFTQYFTSRGHALHLNYWAPEDAFGREPTSHGCIGMRYRDAEFFWNFAALDTRVVIHE